MSDHLIGLDIGGTHVAGALLHPAGIKESSIINKHLDSGASALSVIDTISLVISELTNKLDGTMVTGIAIPGPFNYPQGVCEIQGVGGKFANCFGLQFKEALRTFTGFKPGTDFYFFNDAHCFALGAYQHLGLPDKDLICITLGTGFGSAFILNGAVAEHHENIPPSGMFYNEPFKEALADDYFSSRWLVTEYQKRTGRQVPSVKELAELAKHDPDAITVFNDFGDNLASFLAPWIRKSASTALIAGGNLTRTWELFSGSFNQRLKALGSEIDVSVINDTELRIMEGAALLARQRKNELVKPGAFRKTRQTLLPSQRSGQATDNYEIFPSYLLQEGIINTGFQTLARAVRMEKTLIIDGYGGVLWEQFRENMNHALWQEGVKSLWFDINACLKKEHVINQMIADSLNGDDPVFGKKYGGQLSDFFDEEKLGLISPDDSAGMCIVYGTGASLSGWTGKQIYLDTPKNEIQYRMRAKTIYNLGSSTIYENTQMYKRFYFVDWPVLNEHKRKLLPEIDLAADEQRVSDISWISGDDLRNALKNMLKHAFRARPWFEAGVWGGQWMKQKLNGLNRDEINYAWSFELITPENGIVLEQNNNLLEISFDFILFHGHEELLGKAATRFGYEFPIRFDFLDTFDGGNLSIQCHPRPDYIRSRFGEHFTQDETYYILDAEKGAEVYLGFQDDIDKEKFRSALEDAQQNKTEIDIKKFVQCFPAKKHDLFLIPNGTIHASGRNNMVLEISSTPYIFTFKMYDWQRLDLTGKPRPINIEHAFSNLYFDRKGDQVPKDLISRPELIEDIAGYKRYLLPTHPEHFYRIERYEFSGEIKIRTNGQCHIGMLVEGSSLLITTDDRVQKFHYAETFVVPAAAGEYKLLNNGAESVMVVIAYVKDELQ
jgi:predicted NBD/HSP70 family sugar kinase/mannose-6-phosphate isomerase class I